MPRSKHYPPEVHEVCRAMFIEGARVMGFPLNAPLPLNAQQTILEAAQILAQKLALMMEIQRDLTADDD